MHFVTAETPAKAGLDVQAVRGLPRTAHHAPPKAKGREKRAVQAVEMEEVCLRFEDAFTKVARNRGSPGPDGESIEDVREHLHEVIVNLRRTLLEGTYQPGDIRRVWIPKASGGQRGLGIPNVVARIVQEAIRQVVEPLYDEHRPDAASAADGIG